MPFKGIKDRALDRQSAATVTIMVYYTPEFEQEFDNPQSVIDSHIAATNDAFKQSGLGHVQLQLLCSERIDVMDAKTDEAGARLDEFTGFKGGDVGFILNSADIAVLMTKYGVGSTVVCNHCDTRSTWVGKKAQCFDVINSWPLVHPSHQTIILFSKA